MNLPKFSVTRRVTVTMLILILVLFGGISLTNLGLDMMPDLEFPTLTVATAYPGAAAEDVEQLVTRPIESAVAGVKGIDKLTSTSSEGLSQVSVNFKWGTDLDAAGQDIRENLSRIRNALPADIVDPMVLKMDMSQMPVVLYGVTGMNSAMELQKYFEDAVVPRVERLEGVASMTVVGGPVREINVFLNKTRMDQYGIGPDAVMGTLMAANMNVSSGHISAGHREYLVRTRGEYKDISTIANTIIATVNGGPIRVSDVARVEDTQKERRNYVRMNGKDGVVFMVTKQSGENTLNVVTKIRGLLEELRPSMPADIEFVPIFDQGEMVERVTGNTVQTAVLGAFLAVVILWFFLRNWRPTFVIAIAIPISIVTTFIGLWAFGYTLNVITLGGFALAVGMLIDNAVVVIENIYRHLEGGKHRNDAAVVGTGEVGLAITASTLTTVAVFVPLTLAGGFAGKIAQPLALTVCAGLLASLLVAVTIVPMLSSVIFKKKRIRESGNIAADNAIDVNNNIVLNNNNDDGINTSDKKFQAEAHGGRFFRGFQSAYTNTLGWVLNHRAVVVTLTIAVFGLSMYGMTKLGGEFMAESDNGMGSFSIKMPVGTNLEETNRLVGTIEERVLTIAEVQSVCVMIGRLSDNGSGPGGDVNEATVYYRLKPFAQRSRSAKQVTDEIRRSIPDLYDVVIDFSGGGMMGGSDNPIELKFFGNDLAALKEYADSAKAVMGRMEGLHDVNVSMREGKPEVVIVPDRDKSSMMGFSMAEIGSGIRYANLGQVVTRFREAGEEYDVRIRLDEGDRASMGSVTAIPVISRSGVVAQVGSLGEILQESGPISIYRENRVRCVTVTAKTESRDIQSEMLKVQAAMADIEAAMPGGYFVEYGGSFEDMQETFRDLLLAVLIALILVYMVMAAQFESFTQPLIVMMTVPLAFIGVVFGLSVMGHPLSVTAFIGIIVLIGVVLNNGIVMITFVNQLRDRGRSLKDALVEGAAVRLRPILITSITTIIAVLPMALSKGQGSEMLSPLGTVVAFGLATSTLLTLFVVPVFYSIIDGLAYGVTGVMKKVFLGETQNVGERRQPA
ncbi:MAG: efflux RND transporter permease subunit [Chitinispirillia bacterium]|nr:efflux RND transporter permease subunit [Chitinispirillia bacterium]MCL2242802.1 efflux RND transporter permease subunit [Chitinispirillia bacterium]